MQNELSELVHRWHRGWITAEGLSSHDRDGYLVVDVHRPHRWFEWIATDATEAENMARIVAATEEANWLSVPTRSPAATEKALEAGGMIVRRHEAFMGRDLKNHPAPPPPAGYTIKLTGGPVIEAQVLTGDGEVAASGLTAVVGTDAVPHRIETFPGHRRRGLGSVLMGALVQEAISQGAADGLLFATADGEALYARLGWEKLSDLIVAQNQAAADHRP